MSNITLAYLLEEIKELAEKLKINLEIDDKGFISMPLTKIDIKYLNEPLYLECTDNVGGLNFVKKVEEYQISISKFEYYKVARETQNKLKKKYGGTLKKEITKEFSLISGLRVLSDKIELYTINLKVQSGKF
jgi:hypothetical protein